MSTKLVIFNLPSDIRDSEVEDLFRKYGRLRDLTVRNNRGATYAFIEYEDPRDAEEALDRRNDYSFAGKRLRVEYSKPPKREAPAMKEASYRVKVSGLPRTASWQDLKDFMRVGGDVKFTDVDGSVGIAGFASQHEMDKAVRELDDTKFRARNGDTAYVRVKEDGGRGGGRRSDSRRSRSRGSNRKRTPSRSRSRRRSASRYTDSRSPSRRGRSEGRPKDIKDA